MGALLDLRRLRIQDNQVQCVTFDSILAWGKSRYNENLGYKWKILKVNYIVRHYNININEYPFVYKAIIVTQQTALFLGDRC